MFKNNLKFFIFIFFLVVLDQMSKFIYRGQVVLNAGISFSFNLSLFFTIGISVVLIGVGFYLLVKRHFFPLGMSLILAGAISNLIDRLLFFGVRDFLDVPFLNLKNNLADWMIVIGIILIVIKDVKLELKK